MIPSSFSMSTDESAGSCTLIIASEWNSTKPQMIFQDSIENNAQDVNVHGTAMNTSSSGGAQALRYINVQIY